LTIARLGFSRRTLWTLAAERKVQRRKLGKRNYYKTSDLLRLIETGGKEQPEAEE
jgi:hypothetical protein